MYAVPKLREHLLPLMQKRVFFNTRANMVCANSRRPTRRMSILLQLRMEQGSVANNSARWNRVCVVGYANETGSLWLMQLMANRKRVKPNR